MVDLVSTGDVVDVDCVGIGSRGDGVCKYHGLVIIVEGAKVDRAYKVRVSYVGAKVAFGEIVTEID